MHSSRMRTVRCSGCLGGCLPKKGICLGGGVCLEGVVSVRGGVCLGGGVCPGGCTPPMDRFLDTRLGKHFLSATTVAGGKKWEQPHMRSKEQIF